MIHYVVVITFAPPALVSRRCFGTMHGTAYGLTAEGGPIGGAPWIDGGRLRLVVAPAFDSVGGVKVSAPIDGRECADLSYADEIVCGRWSADGKVEGSVCVAVTVDSNSGQSVSTLPCKRKESKQ